MQLQVLPRQMESPSSPKEKPMVRVGACTFCSSCRCVFRSAHRHCSALCWQLHPGTARLSSHGQPLKVKVDVGEGASAFKSGKRQTLGEGWLSEI